MIASALYFYLPVLGFCTSILDARAVHLGDQLIFMGGYTSHMGFAFV
jgi:hypothetical protein